MRTALWVALVALIFTFVGQIEAAARADTTWGELAHLLVAVFVFWGMYGVGKAMEDRPAADRE